jgi:CSLREA domain-containing protein
MRVRASLLATVAALLVCASPASATVAFDVNTTADDAGANCQGTGPCSIRGAIAEANRIAGTDTINVPAGDYLLTNQLTISTTVNINGASAATTTIRANKTNFRVFQVGVETPVTLTLQRLTIADGATTGAGGNILVNSSGLAMLHVHVTGGTALRGGGIALNGSSAAIFRSLIDANKAVVAAGAGPSGEGGGIAAFNNPQANRILGIADSTITGNTASTGGGVLVRDNPSNTTTLTRDTIAFNSASAAAGGGVFITDPEPFNVAGSIVSNNTGVTNPTTGQTGPSNCGGAVKPTSNGSNVESLADCNFITTGDRRNANPQLSTQPISAGGETRVLTIPSTSPAVDLIPIGSTPCTGNVFDQRDVARPIGAGCDAGAYEGDFVPPPTSIDSGPSGTTTDSAASFTFSSTEAATRFDCRLDGPAGQGTFAPCTSPANFSGLGPGAYTFFVRATDAAGNTSTTSRSFTVAVVSQQTPTPTPTPTPVPNKSVVIQPVSGKVLVKLPGKKTFEPVDVTRGIPDGATVDTTKGKIRLFAIPKAGKPAENALFYDGIFQVRLGGGITELRLTEALSCPSGKAAALTAKKKPKTRKLWGDGSGSFRTRGQYSAATVRGTKWLVQDSCGKTLTRVAKGVVSVQDFVKDKKILLRAPKSYTARKKH